MKKIITFCFFAFTMILGTQTMSGQSMVEINSLASKKTQELKKTVKFDSETEELVYQTYRIYEQKKYNVDKATSEGDVISKDESEKLNKMLNEKFKAIFSDQQYLRYLEFVDKQK